MFVFSTIICDISRLWCCCYLLDCLFKIHLWLPLICLIYRFFTVFFFFGNEESLAGKLPALGQAQSKYLCPRIWNHANSVGSIPTCQFGWPRGPACLFLLIYCIWNWLYCLPAIVSRNNFNWFPVVIGFLFKQSLDGISDIRDESDRTGMRIVIEVCRMSSAEIFWIFTSCWGQLFQTTQIGWKDLLVKNILLIGSWLIKSVFQLKRGSEPLIVLNNLYRLTSLQSSFSCNMVGWVFSPLTTKIRSELKIFLFCYTSIKWSKSDTTLQFSIYEKNLILLVLYLVFFFVFI